MFRTVRRVTVQPTETSDQPPVEVPAGLSIEQPQSFQQLQLEMLNLGMNNLRNVDEATVQRRKTKTQRVIEIGDCKISEVIEETVEGVWFDQK